MVCGRARVELKKKMRPEVEIKVGTWKGKGFYAQPSETHNNRADAIRKKLSTEVSATSFSYRYLYEITIF